MTTRFSSRKGAISLSTMALLSLLARSYYDTRFILVEEYSPLVPRMDTLWILGFTFIVGGNMVVLLAAAGNSQRAWIALLVYNLLIGLGFGAAYLSAATNDPLALFIITANLIVGVLAAVAVVFQLRKSTVLSS